MAVIVILAIVALIAVPIVLKLIERSKIGSAKVSANNYIKEVESYTVIGEIDKTEIKLQRNTKYNVTKDTLIEGKMYPKINDLVELKGNKPTGIDDYVILDENLNVKEAVLTMNGYKVSIKNGKVIDTEKDSSILPESITLNKNSLSIKIGEEIQLNAEVKPDNATNKNITWTSSDKNIATVDKNGLVKGV